MTTVDSLLAQQDQCRRNRKDQDDYCTRKCRRCSRCRYYRASKTEGQ